MARRQALTAEAIALLDIAEEPPLEGIRDVREVAALAARGGVLTASALRHIADTIAGSLRARAALDEQEAPLLAEHRGRDRPGPRSRSPTRSTAPSSRTAPT